MPGSGQLLYDALSGIKYRWKGRRQSTNVEDRMDWPTPLGPAVASYYPIGAATPAVPESVPEYRLSDNFTPPVNGNLLSEVLLREESKREMSKVIDGILADPSKWLKWKNWIEEPRYKIPVDPGREWTWPNQGFPYELQPKYH